jgi:transglutaminase-like putative cysteine protease
LAAVVDASPDTAPSALVREVATLSVPYDRRRTLEARRRLKQRGEPSSYWVEAEAANGKQAVVEAAKQTFDGGLDDADEGIAAAQSVSRAGAHDAAAALFTRLVAWAPNRADAWAGLAAELAATDPNAQAVNGALRRARDLAPGEARYRAELSLRRRPGQDDGTHDDERYLVSPQVILARRQGVPTGTADVSERQLHFVRAVVMHENRHVSQLMHYAREIVIAPRTEDELVEDIPAEGDLTEILRARVHRKSGGVAFPVEEHNEGARPRIRWPELLPGDTVEVAIRTWTQSPVGGRGDPPFTFVDYSGGISTKPTLYDEVVVEAPAANPIYVDVVNGAPDRREEKDERGRHVLRLVWDKARNVPDEPLAPPVSELVPVTVGSTFKDWNAFRDWYAKAVSGFTDPDDEVKRLAAKLTKGKTSREEKLQALFNFVADDIRYVNYVSGEWWLPNRPQELLAKREGDCDDKAMLLITLLKAIGVEAQEVMVQTRLTAQPSLLRAKGAAVPIFDHGIAYLPGPNGGTYLDATSPQSRLGPLPSMDARAVALRLDAGPGEIVELPASAPEDHGSEVEWTITLSPTGAGDLAGVERHSGDGAFWLRTYLSEAGARAQYVEDHLVSGWFPTIAVDKQIDFKGDLPQGRAWVRYKAHSDGMARHEQGDLVLPLSQTSTLASQLAPLVQRTLPVWLPPNMAPSHEARAIKVVAPHGFHWAPLPPGGDENGGSFGRAHLDVAKDPQDPRAVVVKQTLVFGDSVVPVDKYAAWRAWLQRVDSLLHKSLRLVAGEGDAARGAGR